MHVQWRLFCIVAFAAAASLAILLGLRKDGARPRTWTNPRDGSVLVYVPAGPFTMGCDEGEPDERPAHRVTLGSYWIGRTMVTNAQFAKFLNLRGNRDWHRTHRTAFLVVRKDPPVGIEKVGDTYQVVPGQENHPASGVSWFGAYAYCHWAGLRLPTEAEWEKAARGTDGRIYPWGNDWDPHRANGGHAGLLDRAACPRQLTTPVDAFPDGASPYGCLDMAGNLWEWCNSIYVTYPYNVNDGRENPDSNDKRVLRGGAWYTDPTHLRTTNRYRKWPTFYELEWCSSPIGFRVARSESAADRGEDEEDAAPSPEPSPVATPTIVSHPSQLPEFTGPVLPLSPQLDAQYRVTAGPHPTDRILGYPITVDREKKYALPVERMEELLWVGRDAQAHPEVLIPLLGLHEGDTVADIGAGPGYWTFRLADAVGASGSVWATDISSTALQYLQKRMQKASSTNIHLVLTDVTDCLLPRKSLDVALVAQTQYFYYPRAEKGRSPPKAQVVSFYRSIYNALKPGGRMCVVDRFLRVVHFRNRGRDGIYADEVIALMKEAGFAFVKMHVYPRRYPGELLFDVIMFRRP